MYGHRSIVPSAGPQGPPSGPPPSGPGGPGASQAAAAAAAAAAAQQGPHPGAPGAGGPGGPASSGPPGAAAGPPGAAPPAGAPHTSSARLADLLDFVRHEFDLLGNDTAQFKAQRDEMEHRVTSQVSEVNMMQTHFYELEKRHAQIIQQYEEEVKRLRSILDSRGLSSEHGAPPATGPMSGPPHLPASATSGPLPIASAGGPPPPGGPGGAGSAAMFGPNGNGALGGPGSEYGRGPNGFDRERDPPRGPTPGGKDSKRMRVEGPGSHYSGPPSPGAERERDWIKKEERDRGAPPRGDDKWDRDQRMGGGAPLGPGPAQSPRGAPPLPPSNSYNRDMHRDARERDSRGPEVPSSADSPGAAAAAAGNVSLASLSDMDPDEIPKDLKKEGPDWLAIFNPKVKRTLDVNLVHTFLHESVVCCVRFSADGKYLATGCNKSAQIFDTKTGAKTCVLTDQSANSKGDLYIRSVCFSPDGKCLATGAEDRQIRIWDIGKKKVKHLFSGHKQEIYSLDYSKDGRIIASGSGDKTVRIWDVENGQLLHTLYTSPGLEHGPSEAGVTSVSISSDNRLVAAGALDTLVRVWDAQTGKQLERLKSHKDSIYSVSFAPDGKSLVSGSLDKTLKLWDLTGTAKAVMENRAEEKGGHANCATTFVGHKDYVLSVSCSPDGQWVASGSKDRGVQFWDPKTAQAQFVLQGHKNSVIAINLSPAGGLLATGSGDFNARIWSYDRIPN